jgi:hypothetical protein
MVTGPSLAAVVAALWIWLARRARPASAPIAGTWDCGYTAPSSRMQYTASSFARTLVGMFSWALRPETHAAHAAELFPRNATFHSHVPDTVLDRAVLPASRAVLRALRWLRWMQQGDVHMYLLYVLVTLVLLLIVGR